MKKKWNVTTRQYDYVAEGLFIDGIDYNEAKAYNKWIERKGASKCSKTRAQRIIRKLIADGESFAKHHNWLEEMEHCILKEHHASIDAVKGKGKGVTHTVEFGTIPSKYRAGLLAIANNNTASYARGPHNTCPAHQTGAVTTYKEFHLTKTGEEGRATTAKARTGNLAYIYYSTSHAFSTYNYFLVTIPVSIELNGAKITKQVPLTTPPRDGLITLPTA